MKLAKHRYQLLPNNRPLGKLCSEWKHCTKPPEIVILLQSGAANVTGFNSDLGLASHLVLGHMPKGTQVGGISLILSPPSKCCGTGAVLNHASSLAR